MSVGHTMLSIFLNTKPSHSHDIQNILSDVAEHQKSYLFYGLSHDNFDTSWVLLVFDDNKYKAYQDSRLSLHLFHTGDVKRKKLAYKKGYILSLMNEYPAKAGLMLM